MDAIEIVKTKLPQLANNTYLLMDIAMVFLDNPKFAQAVIDHRHDMRAEDLAHDIKGLMSRDEHFVPRIG
jgi:hypothetical protein